MFERWGRAVARWRWLVLAVSAVGVAVGGWFGPTVFGSLSNGGFDDPHSDSTRIEARIAATVGRQASDVVVLYSLPGSAPASASVDDPQVRSAIEASLARLPSAQVRSVTTYWSSGQAPVFVSGDRRATFAAIQLAGAAEPERVDQFRAIESRLRDADGLTVRLGGGTALDAQISDQVSADLARAESLSMPLLLLLLVLVFGSLVAAGLPLVIGLLTVLGSFTVLRGLTEITDVSVFAINIVTLLGLGLAIDYSLFIVSRFREERRARPVAEALAVTMSTAGRTVAFSAVTVAISLTSLALFPEVFLRSMAFGGVAAVLVAMVGAMTLLPALLAVLDHRVDAVRLPVDRLVPRRLRRSAAAGAEAGGWARFAQAVMRRPVVAASAVVVALLVLAIPTLRVEFGGIDSRALPVAAEGRQVDDVLHARFSGAQAYPLDVLVDGGGTVAGDAFATAIRSLDGVTDVSVRARSAEATLLSVDYRGGQLQARTLDLVKAVRALPDPAGATVLVGGATASHVDLRASIGHGLPWMAGLMALATFVLLFLAFGSVVVPVKAILTNLLSLGASFGVVVWIFQEGHLAGLLGFTSTGTIETTQPILMLAILFGLSTDYEVFLLSRIREQWDATSDPIASVATGLQRTGRIITSAALLLVLVIGAFSTSGITFIKMIGVGMAVAIFVDATIVRAILVPAAMRLLGRFNWWAPPPLRRAWERYGWREVEPAFSSV